MKDACFAYRKVQHFSTGAIAQTNGNSLVLSDVSVLYSRSLPGVYSMMVGPWLQEAGKQLWGCHQSVIPWGSSGSHRERLWFLPSYSWQEDVFVNTCCCSRVVPHRNREHRTCLRICPGACWYLSPWPMSWLISEPQNKSMHHSFSSYKISLTQTRTHTNKNTLNALR